MQLAFPTRERRDSSAKKLMEGVKQKALSFTMHMAANVFILLFLFY